MRVVSVVESPLQFFQVAVQVLPAHLVKGADNRTLEQAPHSLDPVGVDLAYHPLLRGMAHGLVYGIVIFNPHVRPQLIGVNRLSLILNCSMDEIMESVTLDIGNALDSNLPAVPLDGSGDPRLAFFASRSDIAPLSTYQRFIHFNDPEESGSGEGIVSHRLSDAVAQIPGCLVGYSQGSVELIGAHALSGFAHQVDRQEPLTQWKVGVVHDGSRHDAELIAA